LKSLFNILFIILPISAFAQESNYSIPYDSTVWNKQFKPTGIFLAADLLGPSLYAFDNSNLSYEFFLETDIRNYSISIEQGHQEVKETTTDISYSMKGNYLRVGPNANFLNADKQLNSFSFGLRYAMANFSENIMGNINENNWGTIPIDFNTSNKSTWIEMTTSLKVRLWQGLFTGYIFRFRFLRKGDVPGANFAPYYVPGYGLAERVNTWGFRYYLMYRFQWSKKMVKAKGN